MYYYMIPNMLIINFASKNRNIKPKRRKRDKKRSNQLKEKEHWYMYVLCASCTVAMF